MPITFTLVSQGPGHVTYLANSGLTSTDPETGTIQPTGAGAADVPLQTAAPNGLIKELVLTPIISDAQAQRLMQDNGALGTAGTPTISNVQGKRCRIYIVPVTNTIVGSQIFGIWSLQAINSGGFAALAVAFRNNAGSQGGSIQSTALIYIEAIATPQRA